MKKIITLFVLCLLIIGCSSSKNVFKTFFSTNETALIMKADSLKPLRVYKITNKQDSLLLRTKSTYIKPNPKDPVLQNFIKRLYATVRDSTSLGVGIAAPQVGILKNIIWVQRFDKDNFPFEVYLNPKIISYSEQKQTMREGCLSIPDRSETLYNRANTITITYDTMQNEQKTESITNFTAIIFQHEIDHLNGILYLDHLNENIPIKL
jgi:peptide deformylase